MGKQKLKFCLCCAMGLHGHCSYPKCWCEKDECIQSRRKDPLCKGIAVWTGPPYIGL